MKENRKVNSQDGGERGNDSKAALLLQERKKIIYNLILVGTAGLIVLIGVLTMAWFANNTKVNGTNMSVTVKTPEGVQVSVGMHANDGTLRFEQTGEVSAPDKDSDWTEESIDISNYYLFGYLIPASSTSGEHIWFTPNTRDNGKYLTDSPLFYQVDGRTDGYLKNQKDSTFEATDNTNSAAATAHAITSAEIIANSEWNGSHYTAWHDTKDDGYYVDIPIWFRSNSTSDIQMTVSGYVKKGDGSVTPNDTPSLYKAVRVAILKYEAGILVAAAESDEDDVGNVIPLGNGSLTGSSILDSRNYTVERDANDEYEDQLLFAYGTDEHGSEGYQQYNAYVSSVEDESNAGIFTYYPVVSLQAASSGIWCTPVKRVIRIWLDGDDQDCWNATEGQNWQIYLVFSRAD